MIKKVTVYGFLLMVVLLVGACGEQMDEVAGATAVPPGSTEPAYTKVPTDSPVLPTNIDVPTEPAIPPTKTLTPPEAAALFQPEQLIASFTAPSETNGEVLLLIGQVVNVEGRPVVGAAVEIWQTDENGVYDHPDDRTTANRDTTFQFYGATTTDEAGGYAFRTIIPGEYEPRPRHIHFKVKQNGGTLLTSQFYFSDDIADVQDEGMFQAVGNDGDLLLVQLVQNGDNVIANGRIVVDMGIGTGELTLTPSQAEGPFYPVVVVAEQDNDLTILP